MTFEQRIRRDRELLAASLATKFAWRRQFPIIDATTFWANGLSVVFMPTQTAELCIGAFLGHAEDRTH